MKCPTSHASISDPNAVFEVPCPKCGTEVEFFAEDKKRPCPSCGEKVESPRIFETT